MNHLYFKKTAKWALMRLHRNLISPFYDYPILLTKRKYRNLFRLYHIPVYSFRVVCEIKRRCELNILRFFFHASYKQLLKVWTETKIALNMTLTLPQSSRLPQELSLHITADIEDIGANIHYLWYTRYIHSNTISDNHFVYLPLHLSNKVESRKIPKENL